jgi:hypothetical protein
MVVEGDTAMSNATVREILDRIERLPAAERALLEDELAQRAEAEWQREAEAARRVAQERGIDQAAIDEAIHRVRHPQ